MLTGRVQLRSLQRNFPFKGAASLFFTVLKGFKGKFKSVYFHKMNLGSSQENFMVTR